MASPLQSVHKTQVKCPAFLTGESQDPRNSLPAMPTLFSQSTLETAGGGLVLLSYRNCAWPGHGPH